VDGEVKVRGNRVHLTEVEAALLRDERVREAAVVARRVGAEGEVRLAAFVVARGPIEAHALRTFLETQLPGYMVPESIELLDALPRTSTNKIDRVGLAARAVTGPRDAGGTPPRSALERTLAEIWREVLALAEVGIDDRFFEIGGQSLLMIRVQRRVEQALGREVPLVDLFRFPTIRALAQHLGAGDASSPARASRPPPRSALGLLRERRRPRGARTSRDEGEDES
jgi:acyl carrier protein